jgi:hypothetical protein
MAKDNPYFKFYTSEWLNGSITLEDWDIQGLFINLCAYYWHKSGQLTKLEANKKFKNPVGLDSLLKENLIGLDSDKITIAFLDEQLSERGLRVDVNRANGKLGGRPKKTQSVILKNPNITNIEKRREELEKRKKVFASQIAAFKERYTREMLKAFYEYWTEHSPNGNKMRFEKESVFDLAKRLVTWANREKPEKKSEGMVWN